MAKGSLLVILALLITGALNPADAMLVTLENDMIQPLAISCHSKHDGDLGLQFLNPGRVYTFEFLGKFVSGKRVSCTFVSTGKPTTMFDVFMGWAGVKNLPCGCLYDACPWLVTANGFTCNFGKFSRGWGN